MSSELLLLAIAAIHLQMLEQLLPVARFDGYWILSDLIGVPDLFARIPPILTHATLGYLLLQLPAIDRALWHATTAQAHTTATAITASRYAAATEAAISAALAAITGVGTLCLIAALAHRAGAAGLRWSAGRPVRRLVTRRPPARPAKQE